MQCYPACWFWLRVRIKADLQYTSWLIDHYNFRFKRERGKVFEPWWPSSTSCGMRKGVSVLDSKSQHCQLKGLSGFSVGITDHLLMDPLLHEHRHMGTTAALKDHWVQSQRKGTLSPKKGWCKSNSAIMNELLNLQFITINLISPITDEYFN